MKEVLFIGDDWVCSGVISDTTLIFNTIDEIEVRAVISGNTRALLTKTGGQVVQGGTNKAFNFTFTNDITENFPEGSGYIQYTFIVNGVKQTGRNESVEFEVRKPKL
jgi:hypothetical protein